MAYGFPEKTTIACPFCNNPILVLWVPETRVRKRASWGGSKAAIVKTRSEEYLVQEDCKHCGKSADEIQKTLNKEQRERGGYTPQIGKKYSFKKGGKIR